MQTIHSLTSTLLRDISYTTWGVINDKHLAVIDVPVHLSLVPTPKSSLPVGTALNLGHVRATGDTWLAACVGLQRGGGGGGGGGVRWEEGREEGRKEKGRPNHYIVS